MTTKEYIQVLDDDELKQIYQPGNLLLWSYYVFSLSQKDYTDELKTERIEFILNSRFDITSRHIHVKKLSYNISEKLSLIKSVDLSKSMFINSPSRPMWLLTVIGKIT